MKEQNLLEEQIKEKNKKEIYSPMRTLFRLTVNSKNSINNSFQRRRKMLSSSIFGGNNNQLNKASSAKNINENKYNSSIFKKNNKNQSLTNIIYNNDNIIYNKSINNEKIYNDELYYINNNNYNNNYKIKNNEVNYKNIINNNINDKNNIKILYNEKTKNSVIKPRKNELKNNKNKNSKIDRGNNKYYQTKNNPINTNTSSGVFNYKMNKINKRDNKYNIKNINNNNNKNSQMSKKTSKNNIKEIEMPFTNSDSKYNIIYNNTKNNNNNALKSSNNRNYLNSLSNSIYDKYNDNIVSETLQPDEFYLNRYNIGNASNIISPNQNIIFNIKKQNIKKVNNILINTKDFPNNIIYSPKRALALVHNQENVSNNDKDIEKINSITENRLFYKNKSVKELSGFTYMKKNNLKTRNNNKENNRRSSMENISQKNNYVNKYLSNSCNNLDYNSNNGEKNKFNNDNENLITKKNGDYYDESKYDIEPDIYPEIKINLKNRKKKSKNNSVILQKTNRYNINKSNIEISDEDNICNNYNNRKQTNIYHKNKSTSIDENLIDKNINNSFLSNINKSVIFAKANISNISIMNNTLSDIGLISNKNLIFKKEKYISSKDIHYILILEEKIKDLADYSLKIKKMEIMRNYSFELINYLFYNKIDKYIENIIKDTIDTKNIIVYNNYTIFSLIILYELTFYEKIFYSVKILVEEIMKLIYSNIILITSHSKNIIDNSEENISILYHIINNIEKKYRLNKDLYLDDNEYLLIEQNSKLSFEEKIDYNLNFIIRNIHTIINNMKNTKNFKKFSDLFKKLININYEEINQFYRDNILNINIVNTSLLSSKVLNNKNNNKINPPYIVNQKEKKYTLVISLDETLIYFKIGSIKNNKGVVRLRPGITELFEAIKPYYEIVVFSSGNKKYTDLIINSFDNKNIYIDYKLCRDHCTVICNDFVKDISRIGRPLDKIVIVDNIPQNYRLHKENGINIKSFYGDNPNDKILFSLSKILIDIARNGGDIRDGIKKYSNEIIYKISSNIYSNYY